MYLRRHFLKYINSHSTVFMRSREIVLSCAQITKQIEIVTMPLPENGYEGKNTVNKCVIFNTLYQTISHRIMAFIRK